MLDDNNYIKDIFDATDGKCYNGLKPIDTMDNSAKKLLEPMVNVYGGKGFDIDGDTGERFITSQAFNAIIKGETPVTQKRGRSKG